MMLTKLSFKFEMIAAFFVLSAMTFAAPLSRGSGLLDAFPEDEDSRCFYTPAPTPTPSQRRSSLGTLESNRERTISYDKLFQHNFAKDLSSDELRVRLVEMVKVIWFRNHHLNPEHLPQGANIPSATEVMGWDHSNSVATNMEEVIQRWPEQFGGPRSTLERSQLALISASLIEKLYEIRSEGSEIFEDEIWPLYSRDELLQELVEDLFPHDLDATEFEMELAKKSFSESTTSRSESISSSDEVLEPKSEQQSSYYGDGDDFDSEIEDFPDMDYIPAFIPVYRSESVSPRCGMVRSRGSSLGLARRSETPA